MLIYAFVEASTRDEALAAGKSAFDRLVGVAPQTDVVCDSYVTLNEEDVIGTDQARWGERPAATPIKSDVAISGVPTATSGMNNRSQHGLMITETNPTVKIHYPVGDRDFQMIAKPISQTNHILVASQSGLEFASGALN
ncbi:hypothetical protein [Halarchaeum salinum]